MKEKMWATWKMIEKEHQHFFEESFKLLKETKEKFYKYFLKRAYKDIKNRKNYLTTDRFLLYNEFRSLLWPGSSVG